MNGHQDCTAVLGACDLGITKTISEVAADPVLVILGCGLFILKGPQIQFFWPDV